MPNREPKEKGAIAPGSAQIHYKSMTGLKEEEERKKKNVVRTQPKKKKVLQIYL